MSKDEEQPSGWRGSRAFWLEAAYEALIEGGVGEVKIQNLAKRLKIARTSFYWHFKNREDLLDALLELWGTRTSEMLLEVTRRDVSSETEAMLFVIGCFLRPDGFDSAMEFAVRGWALGEPAVLERLQREDELRLEALKTMLQRWGHDALDADVRARNIYLVQIGYISMQVSEPLAVRVERLPTYVEVFTGKKPLAEEMKRLRQHVGLEEAS